MADKGERRKNREDAFRKLNMLADSLLFVKSLVILLNWPLPEGPVPSSGAVVADIVADV